MCSLLHSLSEGLFAVPLRPQDGDERLRSKQEVKWRKDGSIFIIGLRKVNLSMCGVVTHEPRTGPKTGKGPNSCCLKLSTIRGKRVVMEIPVTRDRQKNPRCSRLSLLGRRSCRVSRRGRGASRGPDAAPEDPRVVHTELLPAEAPPLRPRRLPHSDRPRRLQSCSFKPPKCGLRLEAPRCSQAARSRNPACSGGSLGADLSICVDPGLSNYED